MNLLKLIMYRFVIWTLAIIGGLCLAGGLLLSSSLVFHFKPYIKTEKNVVWGYLQWERGIPVNAIITNGDNLPDSSFFMNYTYGESSGSASFTRYRNDVMANAVGLWNPVLPNNAMVKMDTILNQYTSRDANAITINSMDIKEVQAYVQPRNGKEKWIYMLPYILYLFLFAWSAWQLSRLLNQVVKGDAFRRANHLRLARIAYGFIIVQFIFLVLDRLKSTSSYFYQPVSSMENYHSPVKMHFILDSHFSFLWLAMGCIMLIVSMAWKDGSRLQEEEDLTL
ncbi:MAG TPA: DUF2975 domain-containing protein [Flavisolibacter sp.]